MEPKITLNKPIEAWHIMAKPTGSICNLDCSYCYYLEKENLYPNKKSWKMDEATLEEFIKQNIQAHNVPIVSFAWQGGEPTLLGLDYFKNVVRLQKKYAEGKQIENAFQTNGVNLNADWSQFFADNKFLIGLSIDGPERLHDHYRIFKGGKPSWAKVMAGIDWLKKYNVDFNTLTVVNNLNSQYPTEVYRFLKQVGSGYMQFIPIVERMAAETPPDGLKLVSPTYQQVANVTEWSVNPVMFGNFLISIFDEWVLSDVGKYFIQTFDVALESWFGMEPSLCVFKEKCGTALVVEHNGDIFSCDHFVYPEFKLGNIMASPLKQMLTSAQQINFGDYKADSLPNYCKVCEYRFACNGECPKNRIIKSPDGEVGLNYLCEGYKMFFAHIDPYMRFMVEELKHERAPANVMDYARALKNANPTTPKLKARPANNAPCPCGSGKKFKHCHGKPMGK